MINQVLTNNINSYYLESRKLYSQGIDSIKRGISCERDAGKLLIDVKESLPYGEFGQWIVNHCNFSHRHANRMMLIARNWEKISATLDTCVQSDDALISLRSALALLSAKPNSDNIHQPQLIKHRVVASGHQCYGEIVEEINKINGGDIIICRTPEGEVPFLRKELGDEGARTQQEIIDVEVDETSDKLKEAIIIITEYLPDVELRVLLNQALNIGRQYLPQSAQDIVCGLIDQEMLALRQAS
jgi:hypothetical protein